jgi:Ni/Fe-hydrogenase 1 B-type cytochrome subunit
MAHEARHAAINDPAPYDATTRLIHLFLAALGIAALVSGQFAGDYRRPVHTGFDIHSWAGIAMVVALGFRFVWGLAGPSEARFSSWLPFTRARLMAVREDLAALASLRIPERADHGGLAGLVQAIGLLAFAWMAVTGAILFAYLETGARATGWLSAVKELHEGAQPVVLAYVALHVGAVIAHSFAGSPVWRRMFPWLWRDAGG